MKTVRKDHQRILKALSELGEANYEAISLRLCSNDRNAISRRLKEMENTEPRPLIEKTGNKSKTLRGRMAANYRVFTGQIDLF